MTTACHAILVALGNPLLDIVASLTSPCLLKKYGLKDNGAILVTRENEQSLLPIFDEILEMEDTEIVPGGSVLNTVRVFQWLLNKIDNQHSFATFFGSIGSDDHAELLLNKMQESKIDMRLQRIESAQTGKCATLVNGMNRSMCALLGAANCFNTNFLTLPQNWKAIETAQFIYTAGFFLVVSSEAVQLLAEHALKTDKPFMFNLSAAYIPAKYKDELNSVLPYVDILFGNEDEAKAFAEANGFNEVEDLKEIAKKFVEISKKNERRKRIVIITRGNLPIIVATVQLQQSSANDHPADLVQSIQIEEFPALDIPTGKFVDTDGAGDAFAGGFMAAFVCNYPFHKCIQHGLFAASIIIQQKGCTFPTDFNFISDQ